VHVPGRGHQRLRHHLGLEQRDRSRRGQHRAVAVAHKRDREAGVNTGNDGRDKDLKSTNFFDIAQFPTATFKSKRVEAAGPGKFKLIGDLTLHGVTKEVALNVEGPSPALKQGNGALRIGASGTTTLNRKDFGMQWSRMIEAAPVVSDEVQVTIDIEAQKR
jgi:polyisoprenoid-binding protein YceI